MGLKSDKTFEDIVERLVALVDPPPADRDTNADNHEDRAPDEADEERAQAPSTTPFDHKKP